MVDRHDVPEDEVAAALAALPREMPPPSHVAAALSRSLSRRRSAVAAWRVAAAAAVLAAAFAAGRMTAPVTPGSGPAGPQFAFLLYGGPAEGGDHRASEYGAWARALTRAGRVVSGERLADAASVAGAAIDGTAPLRGFFVVEARDATEALELAWQHPHARDGTIVVRRIDTP